MRQPVDNQRTLQIGKKSVASSFTIAIDKDMVRKLRFINVDTLQFPSNTGLSKDSFVHD